jgi:hypothetical protein
VRRSQRLFDGAELLDSRSSGDGGLPLRAERGGVERLRRPKIIVTVADDRYFVGQEQLLYGVGSFLCAVH